MTTDPDTLWLEPRCENCVTTPAQALYYAVNLPGRPKKPKQCSACGREPTEYRRVET